MTRFLRITAWIALAVALVSFATLATPLALAFGLWWQPGILDGYDPNAINPIPQLLVLPVVTLPALAVSAIAALTAFALGGRNRHEAAA